MAAIDQNDELLALQMQLDMLEDFKANIDPKGKRKVDEVKDIDLAIEGFKREIEQAVIIATDFALAQSFERAIETDAELLRHHIQEEATAATDHQLARRINDESYDMT